jgi:hypothetical protein
MTNARQTMINRYTRINQENCDEKGKEAYRICRGGEETMRRKLEKIQ